MKTPVNYIIRSGRKSTGAFVNMFHIEQGNATHVAAPKRVFSKAVERNRAKRRVKAAIQRVEMPSKDGFVFFAKKSVLTAEFSDIVDEMKKLAADLKK